MSAAGLAKRGWLQGLGGSGRLVPALAITSVGAIVALTILRLADAPWILQTLGQVVFLASFGCLAIVDFRASVAIAMLELAVYGAGGHWTQFAGGPPGRIVLDAIVMVRALASIGADWRRTGRLELGRYGPHALFLAAVMPAIWMTIGLLNGNRPSDVFADGNGMAFFAFATVFIVLIRRGHGPWLRHWLLVVCAANAIVTGLLILVTASGLVPMEQPLRRALMEQLSFGGNFGHLSNGAYRLYLASGIYLQVGLALTTWILLSGRPRFWPWALYALLWADVLATYTRGFWIGSVLAVGLTLLLGAASLRRPAVIVATSMLLFVLFSGAGYVVGFSLPDYVLNRTASALSTGPGGVTPTPKPGASGLPTVGSSPSPQPGRDVAGEVSNEVRVEQFRVLMGHIATRPILGHGFGSIAADYKYGQIFSYELAYLDLLYKTGIIGLLLFLSFPLRLVLDAFSGRLGRLPIGQGLAPYGASVVVAVVVPLLVTGGTNPYLLAAFGLFPILAMVAWLDPYGRDDAETDTR